MADYTSIIATLDAAILAGATKPVSVSVMGDEITYKTLADMVAAREYFAKQQAGAGTTRQSFRLSKIRPGGAI